MQVSVYSFVIMAEKINISSYLGGSHKHEQLVDNLEEVLEVGSYSDDLQIILII